MKNKLLFIVLFLSLSTACSNQYLYESIQKDQQRRCSALPESERLECEKQLATSYEDYERERKKLKRQ